MTPEELQRAMDFIIEHQARFAAAIEQERQERLHQIAREREERLHQIAREREERLHQIAREREERSEQAAREREDRREQWARDRARISQVETAVLKLTELAEIQSQRLDQQTRDFQVSRKLLERILDRLPDKR
jgi:hypothetical protein